MSENLLSIVVVAFAAALGAFAAVSAAAFVVVAAFASAFAAVEFPRHPLV